jgi:UDP-N-acetylmuramate--alanine ligase
LRARGAQIHIGHDAEHLGDVDVLVYTGALWADNPEYLSAVERGIPVRHRSRALEWIVRGHRLISIAGAHGKTTSTGMAVTALLELGESPTFVNGGVIQAMGRSAGWGTSELAVIEADESDGTLVDYDTAVALITNVDPDHLDHYGSREAFDQIFVDFANGASERAILSADDPGTRAIRNRITSPTTTFGQSDDADVRMTNVSTSGGVASCTLIWRGTSYPLTLQLPGVHNATNASGVFAALVELGFSPERVIAGLESFGGTERRFELHGDVGGVRVYDDYAHHHTEVEAVLTAARTVVGSGRIIAVHQPHLFSRTRMFAGEFAQTLERDADLTVVLDVYGAREDPEPGVTGELVSSRFTNSDRVAFLPDWQEAADYIADISRPGDFVITLGCGDVYRIVPTILDALERYGSVSRA